jgi:hypothetical protein
LSCLPIDVMAIMTSIASYRYNVGSDVALAADTVHLETLDSCIKVSGTGSICSNVCSSKFSVRSKRSFTKALYTRWMRFTLRGSDSKWRYRKFGKRAACEMGSQRIDHPCAGHISDSKRYRGRKTDRGASSTHLYGLYPDQSLLCTVRYFRR